MILYNTGFYFITVSPVKQEHKRNNYMLFIETYDLQRKIRDVIDALGLLIQHELEQNRLVVGHSVGYQLKPGLTTRIIPDFIPLCFTTQ